MATGTELENLIVRLTADNVQYLKTLDNTIKATQQFAKNVAGAFATYIGVKALGGYVQMAEAARVRTEQLKIAIEANGGAVEGTLDSYRQLAKTIADVTTNTKGEILGMLKRAEVLGLTGPLAEAAVKNATAMAGALGGEASEYIRATTALAQGNPHLVARMLGIRGVKNEAELMQRVDHLLTVGLKQAEEAGSTSAAKLARLGKTFDSVKIQVGGLVSEGLTPFLDALLELENEFQNVAGESKSTWDIASEHVRRWSYIGVFEIKNFGRVWDWLANQIAYYLVRIANTFEDIMTKRIPNLAKQLVAKMINALGGNLEVPPDLATRTEGAVERLLREQAEALGNSLSIDMDKFVTKGMDKFSRNQNKLSREAGEGIGKSLTEGVKQELKKLDAVLAFSAEGLTELRNYAANISVTGSASTKGADEQKRHTGLLQQIADNTKTAGPKLAVAGLGGAGG